MPGVSGTLFLVGVGTGGGCFSGGGGVDVDGGEGRRRGGVGGVVQVVLFFALFVPPFLELVVGSARHGRNE